jgi:hypothetical protein
MMENSNFKAHIDENAGNTPMSMQKWGGLASFLLVVAFIAAPWIYLTGNLRDFLGSFSYSVADFLYGPVWAASLITAVLALRERIAGRAQRRMGMALLAAALAAGAMVLVACIRSANRQYHISHPDLHLEESATVLAVWATLVAGVSAAGWHFLGWALVLIGSGGWSSRQIPRGLCLVYLIGGIAALFVYVFPVLEGAAGIFGVIWAAWQGILLWKDTRGEKTLQI